MNDRLRHFYVAVAVCVTDVLNLYRSSASELGTSNLELGIASASRLAPLHCHSAIHGQYLARDVLGFRARDK